MAYLSTQGQHLFEGSSFGDHRDLPFHCVHQAIVYCATAHPDFIAVEHLDDKLSYSRLERRENIPAARLQYMGVRPGSHVCLLAHRSVIMVIGVVGIKKAGVYVPLEGVIVTQPTLDHVIRDSRGALILAPAEFHHRMQSMDVPVLPLDALAFRNDITPHVEPRGVEFLHSNVTNLVCLSSGNAGMYRGYRVYQEVLSSLSNGCTLCIRGDMSKEERDLLKMVVILIATPSVLMPHNPKDYPNIQVVATAGEACPKNIADVKTEGATFYNCYGRTEVTIANTIQSHVRGSTLSIERLTPNNNVYVLNEGGNPLPIGQVGVMWAGDAGVGRGYFDLLDKSAECYKVDPFEGNDVKLEFPPATYNGVIARGTAVNTERAPTGGCRAAPVLRFPSDNNVSLSTLEKADPWDGYENDILPPKRQGRYLRNLRHQIFSLYRRLFGIVFAINVSIAIAILCQGGASAQRLGLIVIANLSSSIFMRQDYVINAFFTVFCAVPLSWPLRIRTICARVYHIGGLHSGFAISGVVWLTLFTGQATRELLNAGPTSLLTVVITYCILVLLLGIVISAIPVLRSKHHNRFEVMHRFLGWTATLLVWCQVTSLTNDYKRQDQSLGHSLIHAAPFWLVLVMTISIALPWVRLRKVPVRAVVLSSHAVRLYFDYATPVAGSFVRISDSPLMEWHSFGTIAEPGKAGFSLVVSQAGDWTSKKILNPPSEIWVRGVPTIGFIHVAPLFRRLVLVATGSGIGPCVPCILERRVPTRLLWTSPNVRQTFGNELVDTILERSPDAVIYDTRVHGRPDMVKLTYRLVREFKAEAVCVISNQRLTQKIARGPPFVHPPQNRSLRIWYSELHRKLGAPRGTISGNQ
ncbi:hypothetical protein BJY52DRAFT_1243941 [Lactarius psammicola]|nr:hypothetical protein BJY52DRAFT_1243941 [Lactarius psammicola]